MAYQLMNRNLVQLYRCPSQLMRSQFKDSWGIVCITIDLSTTMPVFPGQSMFENLNIALVNAPILRSIYWNKIFHVHIDTSHFEIGCVLAQPWKHIIDFFFFFCKKITQQCRKELHNYEKRRVRYDLCYQIV